jgi:putative transposase
MASFEWQPRFYDHIIRDEISFNQIRQYIFNNPVQWESDRENPANLYI